MEDNEAEQNRERRIMQYENRLRELSDSMKHNNIGVSKEGEREKRWAENFYSRNNSRKLPKSGKGNRHPDPEGTENFHQTQQIPTSRYIVIEVVKGSDEKNFKAACLK